MVRNSRGLLAHEQASGSDRARHRPDRSFHLGHAHPEQPAMHQVELRNWKLVHPEANPADLQVRNAGAFRVRTHHVELLRAAICSNDMAAASHSVCHPATQGAGPVPHVEYASPFSQANP